MTQPVRSSCAILAVFPLLLCVAGCKKKMPSTLPPPPPPSIVSSDESLQESLFKGDQQVLSNQDIDRILTAHITMGDRHRLAVLGLTTRSAWSMEIAELDERNTTQFLDALRGAPSLTQVQVMPSLLVPDKRTIPHLREAGARFQADLLLIYAIRIQSFQRDRMIGTDEVRASCTAEAVLLDVRTGIVVKSARSTEAIQAKKTQGDLNFSQTIDKAERESTGRALVKVAESIVTFLREASK